MSLAECAAIVGFVGLGAGLWMAWPPLCPLVLGVILLSAGVVGYLRSPAPEKKVSDEVA